MNLSVQNKIIFCLSITLSLFLGYFSYNVFNDNKRNKCNSEKYSTINPEIKCLDSEDILAKIHTNEKEVKEYIDNALALKKVSRVSVYFRDLKSNQWFGINQLENFMPGSTLKLPLAIAYYKLSEIDDNFLSQQMTYKRDGVSLNEKEHFNRAQPLVSGNKYSAEDLIKRMISDSDNDPVPLLVSNINSGFYEKVLRDIGVHIPVQINNGDYVEFFTTSTYSSILRSLYNASYLNIKGSTKILETMMNSSFKEGLRSGLPTDTKVANKFGEIIMPGANLDANPKLELHDCGIIYKKRNPYILCVMTEGKTFEDLSKVIGDISSLVWKD